MAKLRQLINALAGRPRDAEVSFFDDSSFEFGFSGADGEAAAMLGVGDKVILRGQQGTKKDGITRVFRVTHYQPYVDPSAKTAANVCKARNAQIPTAPKPKKNGPSRKSRKNCPRSRSRSARSTRSPTGMSPQTRRPKITLAPLSCGPSRTTRRSTA